MAKLSLSLAYGRNARTAPILDGLIEIPGVEVLASELRAGEIFWRQLKLQQFDVSEMSLSSYLIATDRGQSEWMAVPVFAIRSFFHTDILVADGAGIERAEDLRGKAIGVPEYQMSAAVWARGALQHEFGVAPRDVKWHMERLASKSHGSTTGFVPPPGVELSYVPPHDSTAQMLLEGRLQALLRYVPPSLLDRGVLHPETDSRVHYLFDDRVAEGRRFFQNTGIYPANHTMVVRKSVIAQHPWVSINLFQAFAKARDFAETQLREASKIYQAIGAVEIHDMDVIPYGIERNRGMLETFAAYSFEQGLTSRQVQVEELFDISTLSL